MAVHPDRADHAGKLAAGTAVKVRSIDLGPKLASAPQRLVLHPTQPSLDNGPVQRRVRRAFVATGQSVLSTSQIVEWTHPRPGTDRHHARRSVRRVCERYCVRVGRSDSGSGRPILWRLRHSGENEAK